MAPLPAKTSKLTQLQVNFLNQLFGPCSGSLKKAADACEIDDYSLIMTDELADAIKNRAEREILMNVPKAIFTMQQMLESPETVLNMDKLTRVCTEFLDRAGLGKVDRNSGSGNIKIGLVILPDKMPMQELKSETIIDAEATEVQAIESSPSAS